MEHKFANIQIAFDSLLVLILRDHSKWRAKKNKHGEGIMLIRTFVLKVINNERKKLTHHEIIDRIAEQTALVIIQVSKESKLRIHPNLRKPRFSFTYSFKFTYKCFARLALHNSYEWSYCFIYRFILVLERYLWYYCSFLKTIHFQ